MHPSITTNVTTQSNVIALHLGNTKETDSPDALLASFDVSLVIAAREFLEKHNGIDAVQFGALVKDSDRECEGSYISVTRHCIHAVVTDDYDDKHFNLKAVLEKPLADLAALG